MRQHVDLRFQSTFSPWLRKTLHEVVGRCCLSIYSFSTPTLIRFSPPATWQSWIHVHPRRKRRWQGAMSWILPCDVLSCQTFVGYKGMGKDRQGGNMLLFVWCLRGIWIYAMGGSIIWCSTWFPGRFLCSWQLFVLFCILIRHWSVFLNPFKWHDGLQFGSADSQEPYDRFESYISIVYSLKTPGNDGQRLGTRPMIWECGGHILVNLISTHQCPVSHVCCSFRQLNMQVEHSSQVVKVIVVWPTWGVFASIKVYLLMIEAFASPRSLILSANMPLMGAPMWHAASIRSRKGNTMSRSGGRSLTKCFLPRWLVHLLESIVFTGCWYLMIFAIVNLKQNDPMLKLLVPGAVSFTVKFNFYKWSQARHIQDWRALTLWWQILQTFNLFRSDLNCIIEIQESIKNSVTTIQKASRCHTM